MNYIVNVVELLREELRLSGYDMPADDALSKLYAGLVLTTGENTTLENFHDVWGVWRAYSDRPNHPNLVWFAELDAETQSRYEPYVESIRRVAAVLPRPVTSG